MKAFFRKRILEIAKQFTRSLFKEDKPEKVRTLKRYWFN